MLYRSNILRYFRETGQDPDAWFEDEGVAVRCWDVFRLYVRGREWDGFMERVYREVKSKTNYVKVRGRCQRYLVKTLQSVEALRSS
jgi:hypothetical protein